MISTLLQVLVSVGVLNWQMSNIEHICQPHQAQKFTCPGVNTFFSASVFWGVIGPKRVFDGLYPILRWCFLIGALLPFPLYALKRYYPRSLKYFQPTVIIGGMLNYAPITLLISPLVFMSLGFSTHTFVKDILSGGRSTITFFLLH